MKKKRKALRFSVFLNILLLAAAILLFWKGGFAEKLKTSDEPQATVASAVPNTNKAYLSRESLFELLPKGKPDAVFLGDELTADCEWNEFYSDYDTRNRGIRGDTTRGVYERLDSITVLKPSRIIIMIGTNDVLNHYDVEESADYMAKILEMLENRLPNTSVYVMSIPPTKDAVANESIKKLNELNEAACEEYGADYINLYEDFINAEGLLKPDYTDDGVNLSGDAYKMWMKKINKFIEV